MELSNQTPLTSMLQTPKTYYSARGHCPNPVNTMSYTSPPEMALKAMDQILGYYSHGKENWIIMFSIPNARLFISDLLCSSIMLLLRRPQSFSARDHSVVDRNCGVVIKRLEMAQRDVVIPS
jgi:hypothetical protein